MDQLPLKPFSVTPYRISTITVTGSVNSCVDLSELYDCIDIGIGALNPSLKYVEYATNKNETNCKGQNEKKSKRKNRSTKSVTKHTKRFDNQMTLHFKKNEMTYNVKLFKNGNVQMTGVKDVQAGCQIVDDLIDLVKHYGNSNGSIVQDVTMLHNDGLRICLMNCDFKILFNINRDVLHKVLLDDGYTCTFEPCIYQGVKLSYFMSDSATNGKCNCKVRCSGKGKKSHCTRITIAFFQSGSVTINGAKNMSQLDLIHNFVTDTMREYSVKVQQRFYKPMKNEKKNVSIL